MKIVIMKVFFYGIFLCSMQFISAQQSWDVTTYPDENGFYRRTCNAVDKLSEIDFTLRSKAFSKCPDTGLPVYSWVLEGESVVSPYTGRLYKQGPTGYFGPKMRNNAGEIVVFGGDPLKYDLNPATAALLKKPDDKTALAFVSIPGNMAQQYHFAATNWTRFYGLLADNMDEKWRSRYADIVGNYAEKRRPSDGDRQYAPLKKAYNLVGFPEEKQGVLGGGFTDGGTENHKIMWRTSALVYAQLFSPDAKISGYSIGEVKKIVPNMFRDFFHKLLRVGNGEYDSHIYYPHSIYAWMNLYDFSKKEDFCQMAKFMLDYDFLTYGLKCVDNTIAGGQKRGFLSPLAPSEMETLTWAFTGKGSKNMSDAEVHLHQATTRYRPNKVIYNILSGNISYPFEAYMRRPTYHMNKANTFQESFFRSDSYGLGNIYMTMLDNPNQQVVWSLVAQGKDGPLTFGGQQPYRLGPSGHSQYSQSVHNRRSLILVSADTGEKPGRILTDEERERFNSANERLEILRFPSQLTLGSVCSYFERSKLSASSWLYIPKKVDKVLETDGAIFIEANETYIVIFPLSDYEWIRSDDWDFLPKEKILEIHKYLEQYWILSVYGKKSGYVLDSAEKKDYESFESFVKAFQIENRVDLSHFQTQNEIEYKNLEGDKLKMQYNEIGFRAKAWLNDKAFDYENWANGYVYQSPYVQIKDGCLYVTDGIDGYVVDYRKDYPVYRVWK